MPKSSDTLPPNADGLANLRLRRMQPRDLEQVLVIERSFPAPWTLEMFRQELRARQTSKSRVAEVQGRILGYVLWWDVADEVHIVNIAVHPNYRRRGVARRLLETVMRLAGEHGMSFATLEVRWSNEAALQLYQALDFKQIAIRKAYYADNGEDAIVMLKPLETSK